METPLNFTNEHSLSEKVFSNENIREHMKSILEYSHRKACMDEILACFLRDSSKTECRSLRGGRSSAFCRLSRGEKG